MLVPALPACRNGDSTILRTVGYRFPEVLMHTWKPSRRRTFFLHVHVVADTTRRLFSTTERQESRTEKLVLSIGRQDLLCRIPALAIQDERLCACRDRQNVLGMWDQ